MKTCYLFVVLFLAGSPLLAQSPSNSLTVKLENAIRRFEELPSMRHAILALVVADASTGKPVFSYHGETGLAAASVQKIVTSAAAYELLGPDFRFRTELHLRAGKARSGEDGPVGLCITGYGDPTLGSWRFASTRPDVFFGRIADSLRRRGVKVPGITIDDTRYPVDGIPRGWIWEDIGNYYGAGVWGVNWKENQFDVVLSPGSRPGRPAEVKEFNPEWMQGNLNVALETAAPGTGDNAYLFQSISANAPYLLGTVPAGGPLTISGAMQSPFRMLGRELQQWLDSCGLMESGSAPLHIVTARPDSSVDVFGKDPLLFVQYSPGLDSITYFFLRKSVNLYGEALLKAMAFRRTGLAGTENGVQLLQRFWEEKGIDAGSLQIMDGSGLSPQNRVTPMALVQVLQFARSRNWFPAFYDALPTYHNMKMKSGSIGGARAFAGYHRARDGKNYSFAIIVNNYTGSGSEAVKAMYGVLDELK